VLPDEKNAIPLLQNHGIAKPKIDFERLSNQTVMIEELT
jgi:hypothetical protein